MAESEHQHQQVHSFLLTHPMGVLSTVSAEGTPWGSAIYYLSDEDFNFYFVTRSGTLKFQNIDTEPLAALTIADAASQTTVQVTGKVSQVPVQEYMDIFFDKFVKMRPAGDYDWRPPIDKIHKGNYVPLHLTPTFMQYADYGQTKTDIHANYIETIIG